MSIVINIPLQNDSASFSAVLEMCFEPNSFGYCKLELSPLTYNILSIKVCSVVAAFGEESFQYAL